MTARYPALALRVILSVLLLVFLVAAWGSGMDRVSAVSLDNERLVPGPFRSHADRSAAILALMRGEDMLASAERAVSADPLDPLGNSLLGSARLQAGDPAGADVAFRVAAQRGWRDRLTQLYWYDAALQLGDLDLAAMRADALLRTEPNFPAAALLLEPLESSQEGQTALARRLSDQPSWRNEYFRLRGDDDSDLLTRRTQVALLMADMGAPLGCDASSRLVTTLLESGMRRDAQSLWRASCPSASPERGLLDPGFDQLASEGTISPFGWRRHTRGDVSVQATSTASGAQVHARNGSTVSRLILSQALDLEPGRYRLTADIESTGADPAGRLAASLDCGGNTRQPRRGNGDPARDGQLLEIGACDRQVLGLWLRPRSGPVTIRSLTLEHVGS